MRYKYFVARFLILNFLIILITLLGFYFLISFVIYRAPNFQKIKCFEGDVVFKAVDVNFNFRDFFEKNLLGNHSVMLASEDIRFYISKKDWLKLWEIKPQQLIKMDCGLNVKISTRPLFFGGYGVSVIDEIKKIETKIKIIK